MIFECGGKSLDLSQPQVFGILNVTPDSFSDGGQYASARAAVEGALRMIEEGAAVIDIGGESTRPGAQPVPLAQELDRVIPVIEALHGECDIPISIDTSKPEVMRAAVAAGASMINDVFALRAEGALNIAAQLGVPVCLMHMQGEPRTMQQRPDYSDVVAEVRAFLQARANEAIQAGIPPSRICIDPGFGFGKTLDHNLSLLRGLQRFVELGFPVLVGTSRKSMLGTLLGGVPPEARVHGGIAATLYAVERGARLIRTHDVRATVDALKVHMAMINSRS